jgi:hypothetical protein
MAGTYRHAALPVCVSAYAQRPTQGFWTSVKSIHLACGQCHRCCCCAASLLPSLQGDDWPQADRPLQGFWMLESLA